MKVIFFTGAGISKESGIPTFQEMDGIRKKLRRSYAILHPTKFRNMMHTFVDSISGFNPNPAHIAIAQLGCPVITMNVDGLHEKAGSPNVLAIHGDVPTKEEIDSFLYPYLPMGKPLLYGDFAPRYYKAFDLIRTLGEGDYFVIVGTSFYTGISNKLKQMAQDRHANVIIIDRHASFYVPAVCQGLSKYIQ